jgi:hypothetical protein
LAFAFAFAIFLIFEFFLQALQQSRSQRADDDSSNLNSLVNSVLRGTNIGPTDPSAYAVSFSAPLPAKNNSPTSKAFRAQQLSPIAAAAASTLERAAAVRMRAHAALKLEDKVSSNAFPRAPAFQASLNAASTSKSELAAVHSAPPIAAPTPNSNGEKSNTPRQAGFVDDKPVAAPEDADRSAQLAENRSSTPAQLVLLDTHLQKILASASSPNVISSDMPSRSSAQYHDGLFVLLSHFCVCLLIDVFCCFCSAIFLDELDRQARELEDMLVSDRADSSDIGSEQSAMPAAVALDPTHYNLSHARFFDSAQNVDVTQSHSPSDVPLTSSTLHESSSAPRLIESTGTPLFSPQRLPTKNLQSSNFQQSQSHMPNQTSRVPLFSDNAAHFYEPGPEEYPNSEEVGFEQDSNINSSMSSSVDPRREHQYSQQRGPQVLPQPDQDAFHSDDTRFATSNFVSNEMSAASARAAVHHLPVRSLAITDPLDLVQKLLQAPTPFPAHDALNFLDDYSASSLGASIGALIRERAQAALQEGIHTESANGASMVPRDFARAKAPVVCSRVAAEISDAGDSDAVVAHMRRELTAALRNGLPWAVAQQSTNGQARATLLSRPLPQASARRHVARTLTQAPRRK